MLERRPIKNYENYLIDIEGNIYNTTTNKPLKGSISEHGYKYYRLSKDGKKKMFYAHRLVAEMFLSNPNNFTIVNHIDGNKLNNNVNNLEWVSCSENINHAYNTKLRNDKYKVGQYDKNGLLINTFESELEAFRKTGINHINEVTRGLRKTAGGYIWKRLVNNVE